MRGDHGTSSYHRAFAYFHSRHYEGSGANKTIFAHFYWRRLQWQAGVVEFVRPRAQINLLCDRGIFFYFDNVQSVSMSPIAHAAVFLQYQIPWEIDYCSRMDERRTFYFASE